MEVANNVNIVYYKKMDKSRGPIGWMRPFSFLEHGLFVDLEKLANCIVTVEQSEQSDNGIEEYVGRVETRKPIYRPFWPQ